MIEQIDNNPLYEISVKLKSGDEKSFRNLFDLFCKPLIYFSYRFTKDQETSENIVQDVLLKIWVDRDKIDVNQNLKTYLYTSVKNDSLKYLRHMDVRNKHSEEISNSQLQIYKQPDEEINQKEFNESFYKVINNLPEKCGQVFKMAKFDGLKYAEIANIMDISIKTVENQMGRALKILRENLKHLIALALFFLINKFL